MANEVFKTPDVYIKEVDNTFVRDTSNTVFGTGAITLKANQGPVNQRLLFTRFRDFQQVFGKPTSTTDYGHFAARLYMAVAPSLYVIRASYGDEGYATIQYPSVDAFKYNNYADYLSAGNPYIRLTTTAEVSDLVELVKIEDDSVKDIGYKDIDNQQYLYTSKAVIPENGVYVDLKTNTTYKGVFSWAEISGDSNQVTGTNIEMMYDEGLGDIKQYSLFINGDTTAPSGTFNKDTSPKSTTDYYTQLNSLAAIDNVPKTNKNEFESRLRTTFGLNLETSSFDGTINQYDNILDYYVNSNSATKTLKEGSTTLYEKVSNDFYYPFDINIPNYQTLDNEEKTIKVYIKPNNLSIDNFDGNYTADSNPHAIESVTKPSELGKISGYCYNLSTTSKDMTKLNNPREWDSNLTPGEIYLEGTPLVEAKAKDIRSIAFTEFNMGDETNALVAAFAKAEDITNCPTLINEIYYAYGTNAIEAKDYIPYVAVRLDNYGEAKPLPAYCSAVSFEDRCNDLKSKLKPSDIGLGSNFVDAEDLDIDLLLVKNEIVANEELFISYIDANSEKPVTTSVHNVTKPVTPTVPVNCENTNSDKFKDDVIKEVIAIPTNQALVMYPDGYTPTCDTDEEPGIGDLESIKPWCGNSLVIGAIGPGKYANDLGIAIVTPDQHDIKALNIPNAFDWRWRFDDEDKNRDTPIGQVGAFGTINDMIANGENYPDEKKLIWTQVYKINVYRKPSDKTAEDAWGKGKEALASNIPVESWLVSNDPKLVDGNGDSLYAPNVINGKSNFIYISRKSVQSMGKKLPKSTFGIFQLVGGKDGTKSGINQKQAALQLYSDPNKANFDLIFNTDAIESFASREKFKGAQIKYGEIAGSRGEALAIVQATSKEAKKLAKAQAEGKGFSFDYPSYVAMYAGYDKFFDPDLSTYVYLPKSVAAAVTEGWIMYNRNPWDAPAGVENGSIEYTTGSQLLNINAEDLGELYSNNINCSRTMPIYGEVLWGNKTAQKKNTALRSINVRVLLNYVKKNVKQILTPYIFKNNTDTTRAQMKNQLVNFMGGIEQQGGCTKSRVRVWCSGEDLMNHIVRVEIGFIPPYTIEFIPVSIVLDSAANTIDILEA